MELVAQVTWPRKTEFTLSALKSHLSHVLLASIYRNCESLIEVVLRVQISVEADYEKNVHVKKYVLNRLLTNRIW